VKIRAAASSDAPAVAGIYAHWVETSAASFEEAPPGDDVMAARMRSIVEAGLPFLVAEENGRVLGYSYLHPYHERSAYRRTAEDSVYVAPDARGRGVGRALLEHLLAEGERAGVREVIAIIALTDERTSVDLHHAVGFEDAGLLRAVGFKHGRWYDTALMQRSLQPSSRSSESELMQ
jgi:L-amino acid N-acyltransferase YncA